MAKGKSQRALFEILAKERAQSRPKSEGKGGPIVRRYVGEELGDRPAPAPVQAAGAVGGATSSGPTRVSLTVYWIVVAAAGVVCLCVLFYLWGTRSRREPVPPNVEPRPTMEEVGRGPVEGGLVSPAPPAPAPGLEGTARAPAPTGSNVEQGQAGRLTGEGERAAPSEGGGEQAPAATEGKFRLRIARLEVTRSEYTDQLRTLLAGRGVETDLAARGGFFVLYSRERFVKMDDEKAKAFEKQVVDALKEFEQKTGWPAATNPYFVTVP